MPTSPRAQLAAFMVKFTPSIAKEGRAALTRVRRLVPGAVQMVYDNWNGLVIGFGPTERASEAVVANLEATLRTAGVVPVLINRVLDGAEQQTLAWRVRTGGPEEQGQLQERLRALEGDLDEFTEALAAEDRRLALA